jgi:hypothetical protein
MTNTEQAVENKIINRITKILAIANDLSATEHERDTALQMAYKLLAKHNLDMVDIKSTDEPEPRIENVQAMFGMPWCRQVCNSVAGLFFCSYYYKTRKINATQMNHVFVGKESNVMTATVMSNYLINTILKECRNRYKHNLCPESRAFATGASNKLTQRVKVLKEEATKASTDATGAKTPGTSLVLANLYDLEAQANELFLANHKFKESRAVTKAVDGDAYYAGKDFGNKLNLNLQVEKTTADQLKLKG